MSAKLLSQLSHNLLKVKECAAYEDFDSAQSAIISVDNTIREVFSKPAELSEEDKVFLVNFLQQFDQVMLEINIKKADTAKELGVHMRTQKKINIYKSIK
ncbi:hypothetical protein [Pseudoalteromonas sp. H105]|uniref:hypothetical protein n=1 Tax=Pseudoalteromonas sp. H105 TaxID=1348393 RepID=UPI0007324371|nr:hypothetical protein [Pseudoalteromonas sp. H105]KTF16140.1 hypothetical protein ATS75_06985 [Pseudoalteromonas sp. H105]